MKFKINKSQFVNGLQLVLNVVGTRTSIPILNNVLIKTGDNFITLTTTNLDLGIECKIKAVIEQEGSVTLPVKKLSQIIKDLPSQEVVLECENGANTKIKSGRAKFNLMGLAGEDFPALPTFSNESSFSVSQADLSTMLKNVTYAQSTDENRYILNSVFFNLEEGLLNLVATDGRRLAMVKKDVSVELTDSLILPAKTASELMRILGQGEEIKISFNDRQAAFEVSLKDENSGLVENIYIVSKVVEGVYPNYKQVIPKTSEYKVKIERELLLETVNRISLVTSDKSNSIKMKFTQDNLEIFAQSSEYGEASENIAIEYKGEETVISFNPDFIKDPLKNISVDEVFFEFKDELNPSVFKSENFLCVVMPLRV